MLATMTGARLIRRAGSTPVDAALAGALLLATVAIAVRTTDPFPYGMVPASAALGWRRRWPTAVCTVVAAAFAATFPQPLTDGLRLVIVICLVLAAYAAAVYARHSWLGTVLLAAAVAPWAHGSRLPVPDAAVPFLVLTSAWLAGVAARSRARSAQAWRAEAARTAGERDAAYATAVRDERSRIARELHDVVTHRVSVMVIAAGAARTLLPGHPGRAVEQLHTVEYGGREALAELRGLLSLLAPDTDGTDLHPQPGLGALPALCDSVTAAGLPVTYRVHGSPRRLPPGLDLAAYRIVQEALTNSLRHSTRTGTRVTVGFSVDALTLNVVDSQPPPVPPPATQPGGRGLIGIRERVAVYGGSVTVHDDRSRPYGIIVRMPIPPATDTAIDAVDVS
jgi:signal transduction histidine kinase